jgi:hypothetical protein
MPPWRLLSAESADGGDLRFGPRIVWSRGRRGDEPRGMRLALARATHGGIDMNRRSTSPPIGAATSTPHQWLSLSTIVLALTVAACDRAEDETDTIEENPQAAAWRQDIRSQDPAVRARGADMVPGAPGDDGVAALEELALGDPDARVREQAVVAYAALAGKDAVTLLKDVALGDDSEEVTSAAMAQLAQLREEHPEPARGWMDVDFPSRFEPGGELEVRVRFGSTQSADKVLLQLVLPEGFTAAGRGALQWRGAVVAGEEQELSFQVLAPRRSVQSGARAHLHLDYPEQLDVELVQKNMRVAIDAAGGRFEPQSAATQRAARATENAR